MNRTAAMKLATLAAVFALAACGELPQDGPKPFVSKEERRSFAGTVPAERVNTQDEYPKVFREDDQPRAIARSQ